MDDFISVIIYLVFMLIIFLFSAVKNAKKQKGRPLPKPVAKPLRPSPYAPSPVHREETPADTLQRELAKWLGVEEEKPAPPPPITQRTMESGFDFENRQYREATRRPEAVSREGEGRFEIPKVIPKTTRDSLFRSEETRVREDVSRQESEIRRQPPKFVPKEMPPKVAPARVPIQKPVNWSERIIWAEILGPPKALRRRKVI